MALGIVALFFALTWTALLVVGPLYLGLTSPAVYRRAAYDARLLPRLSAVLAVELAPRFPQTDTYRWAPRQAETLQPVLETALRPETLAPLLAHIGPAWLRWFVGQGPTPEPLSAAVRTYVMEPQRPFILDALWQALPACSEIGALYCRPDELPPAEQGYAYAALRSAWETMEMDLYAALNAWQARAVQASPYPIAPGWVLMWPGLVLLLGALLLALAPEREAALWVGGPLALGAVGAALVGWYLPAWLSGHWVALWGVGGLSATAQGYLLTFAQVLLEKATEGVFSAAGLGLALALASMALGLAQRRWRIIGWGGTALAALVTGALLITLTTPPTAAPPQATPTVWPSPTITLTPTATPYWPVQPGTPVPTPMGGLSLLQPPQNVGCVSLQAEPVHAVALSLRELTAVQSTATTLLAAQTLSPTAVLTHPLAAERALLAFETQVLLAQGTRARLFLLPTMTEVYTSHLPILSPIRALTVLPQRLQVALGLDEGRIWLVEATSGDADWSLWHIERHAAPITVLAAHPTRPWLVSGAANGELWLWDAEQGKRLRTFSGHTSALTALAFSSDGAELLSADATGQLIVWDVASGEMLQRARLPEGDGAVVLSWKAPVAVGGTRAGRLFLLGGETLWASEPQGNAITAIDVHANRIAVGAADGRVCLWTQVRP